MKHSLLAGLLMLGTTTVLAEDPPPPVEAGLAEVVVEGIASDPEGRALPGVEVSLLPMNRTGSNPPQDLYQRATTSDDGRFRFTGVHTRYRWGLRLQHPEYIDTSINLYRLPLEDPLAITLARGASVSGRVLDEDGRPVAGAEPLITIDHESSSGSRMTSFHASKTTEGGTFRAAGIEIGTLRLEVRAEGFMETTQSFVIRGQEHLEGVELILRRGHSLQGQVLDAAGAPVPEATIWARAPRESQRDIQRYSKADSEGRFVLENLPLGALSLSTEHPEKGAVQKNLQMTPELAEIELRLEHRPKIEGQVLAEATGAPLANAEVALRGDWGAQFTSTGEDGSFRIYPDHPGPFRLRVTHPGFMIHENELEGDPTAAEHVLRLSRGLRLTGKVQGATAQDLAYLEIHARPVGKYELNSLRAAVQVADEGSVEYELTGLYPEEWELWITVEGSARQGRGQVTIPEGATEETYDLTLSSSTLTLSGQVRVNGEPVPSVRLFPSSTETDHQGRFAIEGLDPGPYVLMAQGPWGTVERRGEIYSDQELLIDLEAFELSLQVFLPNGQPASEAQVFLRSAKTEESPNGTGFSQQTNAEGRLWLPMLLAGKYHLTAFKEGFGPGNQELELQSDKGGLELFLKEPTALSLQARHQNGEPVQKLAVMAFDDAGQIAGAGEISLDAEGRGTLETLSAGNWNLMVLHEGSAFLTLPIKVPGDTLQLELEPATHLRVQVPALQEAKANGELEIFDAGGQAITPQIMGRPGESWPLWEGVFELPFLPAGTWTLRATDGKDRTWEGKVTTHPDEPAELVLQ